MARLELRSALRHLRRLLGPPVPDGLSDRQLLQRFTLERDEAAFATLVHRHAALVWGTASRTLRSAEDVEDVFQASFLVLARKAASVRWRESVASWLYGVARRLAAKTRTASARRHALERRAEEVVARAESAVPDAGLGELYEVLDEELQRLPEQYRSPLLLCYLEGRTRDQAAGQLGWSVRTLHRRLERGLGLLRARLTRRGVDVSAALLTAALGQQAVEAGASAAVVGAVASEALAFAAGAGGEVSASVAALAEGVVEGMAMTRLKVGLVLALAVGVATAGAGAVGSGRDGAGTGGAFCGKIVATVPPSG